MHGILRLGSGRLFVGSRCGDGCPLTWKGSLRAGDYAIVAHSTGAQGRSNVSGRQRKTRTRP